MGSRAFLKSDLVRRLRAAKVQVKVSWYLDREGTLHETHALQSWERHGKEWWMVDAVRVRGHEMPGLTERAQHDDADETAEAGPNTDKPVPVSDGETPPSP